MVLPQQNWRVRVTHSQLLEGLKCESKWKTTEEGGVGMYSLAHNTLRGRGACWSSGMGLGRIDKLIHSHGPAHNPHKVVGAPLVLGPATGNTDTQDSPRPGLGGSHHLPPYSILCDSSRDPHPNGFSLPGLPPCGIPGTLKPHNFASRPRIEVQSKEKL
jgi:hypothetical protein